VRGETQGKIGAKIATPAAAWVAADRDRGTAANSCAESSSAVMDGIAEMIHDVQVDGEIEFNASRKTAVLSVSNAGDGRLALSFP